MQHELATRVTTPVAREADLGPAVAALLPDLTSALRLSLAGIHSMEDQDQAHAGRIAAKRLRYALEPIGEHLPEAAALATELSLLQDVLGAMHDAEVLSGAIAAAVEKTGAAQGRRASRTVRRGEVAKMAKDAVQRQRRRDPTSGLLALAAVVRATQEEHYRTLERDWMSGRARAADRRSRWPGPEAHPGTGDPHSKSSGSTCCTGMPDLPDRPGRRTLDIDQGYLPGDRVRERLRRVREGDQERWYRTVKLGLGLERLEFEDETTAGRSSRRCGP